MKVTLVFLLLTGICAAETIWNWDMTELPSGWTANEYWDFTAAGAHSYVSALTSGPYSVSQTAQMFSDTLTVPDSLNMIIVCITDNWSWSGWSTTGESNCFIWFRLISLSGTTYTIEFDSHSWGFDQSIFGSRTAQVEVPIAGGEKFYLKFYSNASSSYGAFASMTWDIESLYITDSGGTSLERRTWAEIKSCITNEIED